MRKGVRETGRARVGDWGEIEVGRATVVIGRRKFVEGEAMVAATRYNLEQYPSAWK